MRAYRVAYDGRAYHGFQRQPDVGTVEDALLEALRALGGPEEGPDWEEDTPPGWAAAGRTDAGVSAVAQTVAFEAPEWLSPAAFSSELPDDVWVWASADAPADFHATHDARERTYTYYLHASDAADGRARDTLDALAGEHDFHNLTPDDEGTVRDLSVAAERDGPFLVLDFRAGGFPRQLVRRAVSLVAESARDEFSAERVDRVLSSEPLPGPAGIPPAQPEPLVLAGVDYPLSFEVDERALADAREWFEHRRTEWATLSRVAGAVGERFPETE